jgi:hypothetical protein
VACKACRRLRFLAGMRVLPNLTFVQDTDHAYSR